MGTNININCFFPQNRPFTAKLCSPVVLKQFRDNSLKTTLFSPKSDYLRKENRNKPKFVFVIKFEKGKILRKMWIYLNKIF